MILHEDKTLFRQLLVRAGAAYGVSESVAETEYFATLIMRELSREGDVVFTGTTALYTCLRLQPRQDAVLHLCLPNALSRPDDLLCKLKDDLGEKYNFVTLLQSHTDCENSCLNEARVRVPGLFSVCERPKTIRLCVHERGELLPTTSVSVSCCLQNYLQAHSEVYLGEIDELTPFFANCASPNELFANVVFDICKRVTNGCARDCAFLLYDLVAVFPLVRMSEELTRVVEDIFAGAPFVTPFALTYLLQTDACKFNFVHRARPVLTNPVPYSLVREVLSEVKSLPLRW